MIKPLSMQRCFYLAAHKVKFRQEREIFQIAPISTIKFLKKHHENFIKRSDDVSHVGKRNVVSSVESADEAPQKIIKNPEKKMEIKEWVEQSPGWLARDQNESQLIKHIEVLQRFSTRNAFSHVQPDESPHKNLKEDKTRKKSLTFKDKPSNKMYGTFATAMELRRQAIKAELEQKEMKSRKERKSLNPIETRNATSNQKDPRTFLTFANEKPYLSSPYVPTRKLSTSLKKKPPTTVMPSSFHLENPLEKKLKPRIYSLVNPKLRNKEFEDYLKKDFLKSSKIEPPLKKKDSTVGEYFTGRYRLEKPEPKLNKNKDNLNTNIKNSLIENRKSSTTVAGKKALQPMIYSKTSALVKKTDLPLQLCKRLKPIGKKPQGTSIRYSEAMPSSSSKLADDQKPKNETLLNRIISYFKQ